MSTSHSNTENLDPENGFTSADAGQPSVSQAANELREAAEGKINEAVHTAEEKFRDTLHKAKEKSSELKELATEKACALKDNASVQAKQLRNTASEQWDETRVKAKEIQITTEDYIRQNPTKCVLGALGAGFLIGLLVRR